MSRFLSAIGAIASLGSTITMFAGVLPPKYAAIVITIGTFLTTFNERLQGGLSKK